MSWMKHMPLLRSLIVNDDNQAINILAPTELRLTNLLQKKRALTVEGSALKFTLYA